MIKERITITDILKFPIGRGLRHEYREPFIWKNILETEGVLSTDVLEELYYEDVKENGFGSMKMEDELETFKIPYVKVSRKRLENDTEYFNRMKQEADREKLIEKNEHLEYLRLKAKFENL